jgi:Predicted DNA-binding protein containing a Zn-ribbon domain
MLIGIDDTDSPRGMCTTYLAAVLAQRLKGAGMHVREVRLIRLNPNVIYKTRGNAAVALDVLGSPAQAFDMSCSLVSSLADLDAENTNPGVVVCGTKPPAGFYWKAVRGFCEIDEALAVLDAAKALYRGYKNRRGLIGATAAICSEIPEPTYELLTYRIPDAWGTPRVVDRSSLFDAERRTHPHTWDTVDRENGTVVCVPHTPDPVLFGIRGERPGWVSFAREWVISEKTSLEQVFVTNQGTDAHLVHGRAGDLEEGCSYRVAGTVVTKPLTGPGGHVSFMLEDNGASVRCMAYEPTKGFRDIVRSLCPGDRVVVCGSYKEGSINLEKMQVAEVSHPVDVRPPVCERCGKRMTSAGFQKGYKCRRCGGRAREAEIVQVPRTLQGGWYEVPPSARRHLARPLCREYPGLPGEVSR